MGSFAYLYDGREKAEAEELATPTPQLLLPLWLKIAFALLAVLLCLADVVWDSICRALSVYLQSRKSWVSCRLYCLAASASPPGPMVGTTAHIAWCGDTGTHGWVCIRRVPEHHYCAGFRPRSQKAGEAGGTPCGGGYLVLHHCSRGRQRRADFR